MFILVGGYEDDFKSLGIGVAGIEPGKLRSEVFTWRAPVSAEIEKQRGLPLQRTRSAGIVNKAGF